MLVMLMLMMDDRNPKAKTLWGGTVCWNESKDLRASGIWLERGQVERERRQCGARLPGSYHGLVLFTVSEMRNIDKF